MHKVYYSIAVVSLTASIAATSAYLRAADTVQVGELITRIGMFAVLDDHVVTLRFATGSPALSLTQFERSDLQGLVNAVKAGHTLDRIIVATWSDKESPVPKDRRLTDKDIALAQKRGGSVVNALREFIALLTHRHAV